MTLFLFRASQIALGALCSYKSFPSNTVVFKEGDAATVIIARFDPMHALLQPEQRSAVPAKSSVG
eukprot:4096897-Prymnesium_polylepis.2